MAGWGSRLGVMVVTCGLVGGCGAPLEAEDTEVSSEEFTSVNQEVTGSREALRLPDTTDTQRMKSNLPPANGRGALSIPAPGSFASFQGQFYFAVSGNDAGLALWRSDGTPKGTAALKILPELYSLTPTSSHLYFRASDDAHGWEPWVSDGTAAGTRLLKDLTPGAQGSVLVNMTALGSRLVFIRQVMDPRTSAPASSELWTSDGTTSGTVRVLAGLPVVTAPDDGAFALPDDTLALGDRLLFITRGETGSALWRTDGTKAGTVRLKSIGGANTFVNSTLVSNGLAFFHATETDGSTTVWKSDGTQGGTQPLYTYDPSLRPIMLRALGSSLYAATVSATTQRITLRRIPLAGGSESPVITLPNKYADRGSAPTSILSVSAAQGGKKVYFAVAIANERQALRDVQLWGFDGTAAGTVLLHRSNAYSSGVYAAADDLVFFSANEEDVTGIEPWVSDGTPGGTRRLKDMVPGPESSTPREFMRVGSHVFMSTVDTTEGGQVWATRLRNARSTSASP